LVIKESLFEFGQFYFVWSILQSYFEPMPISEGASSFSEKLAVK
jgi:hypothetical protein